MTTRERWAALREWNRGRPYPDEGALDKLAHMPVGAEFTCADLRAPGEHTTSWLLEEARILGIVERLGPPTHGARVIWIRPRVPRNLAHDSPRASGERRRGAVRQARVRSRRDAMTPEELLRIYETTLGWPDDAQVMTSVGTIRAAIRDAVIEEREACAALAKPSAHSWEIAAAIRARGSAPQAPRP